MTDGESMENRSASDLYTSILHRASQGAEERLAKIAELEGEIATLKAETKQLNQIASTVGSVAASIDSGLFAQASRRLDSARQLQDSIAQFDSGQREHLARAAEELRGQARETVRSLAQTVPEQLPSGYELDSGSRFPRFSFRDGFLVVDVNTKKLEASAQTRGCRPVRIDADAPVIVEHVTRELDRCFGRAVDLKAFGDALRNAYDRVRAATGQEAVGLQSVLEAFEGTPPPRDEFAVDLAALIRLPDGEEPPSIRGMKLDHTRDTDAGFLLPGHETTGYLGSISFHTTDNREGN